MWLVAGVRSHARRRNMGKCMGDIKKGIAWRREGLFE